MFKSNELHKIAEFGTHADAERAVRALQRIGVDAWTSGGHKRVVISHYAAPTNKSVRVKAAFSCTYTTVGYLRAVAARHDIPVIDIGSKDKLRKDVDAPGLRVYPIYRTLQEAAEARGIYGPEDLAKDRHAVP